MKEILIKKIVIPAAGMGSRLLPTTKEIPKEMMPLFVKHKSGIILKPLIQILFEKFFQYGLNEYCLIVGKQKRAIEDHFTIDNDFLRGFSKKNTFRLDLEKFYYMLEKSTISWVNQQRPRGFGDAVLYAEPFVGKDDFILSAGDTLIQNDKLVLQKLLKTKLKGKNDAIILLKEVKNPKRFGVAIIKKTKHGILVTNVEEKPKKPKSNLSIVALYRFRPSIFNALREVKPQGKELQLTDGIQKLIERGGKIHAIIMNKNDHVIDIGTAESYLENIQEFQKSQNLI